MGRCVGQTSQKGWECPIIRYCPCFLRIELKGYCPELLCEFTEGPEPSNPLGIKPGSEGGTAASPGVIANAIVDALAEFGVRHIELPATSERVWRAIREVG